MINRVKGNIRRIRTHERCADFISAIQNAAYPQRTETSQSTSKSIKPIHNWTSHYRTALEYMMNFILEQEESSQRKKSTRKAIPQMRKDPVTGNMYYK